ncbi:hypothetical protein Pelo_17193 [Pelomyxa schiedti]|nr:hypothetical protein Pelo_17193 [Pelomyxa schiedti]
MDNDDDPSFTPTFCGVIDARSQFIALGVAGIVGRCGAHSAVSSLSQPLLSLIGRDWIVFPARRSVVQLVDSGWKTTLFVEFSVSPTMGLVDHPTAGDFGGKTMKKFHGWVGPKSAGTRFPLIGSVDSLQVTDRNWKPGSSWELVLNNTRSVMSTNVVACVMWGGTVFGSAWAEIEKAVVTYSEVPVPWQVVKMVFVGDDALAVLHESPTGRAVDVIDLAGTMQHKELRVTRKFTLATDECQFGNPVWCWHGRLYTTTNRDQHIVCVTTGERIRLPGVNRRPLCPVGGPYFKLSELDMLHNLWQ